MQWSESVERILTDMKIPFKKEIDVLVSQIIIGPNIVNQIRPEGTDDSAITAYAASMRDGQSELFPPVVLWERPGGTYEPVDGIHRTKARLIAGVKKCHAYVIGGENLRIVLILRRILNANCTVTDFTARVRIMLAVQLVREGYSIKEAAHYMKVSAESVSKEIRVENIRAELGKREQKLKELKRTHLIKLATLRNDEIAFECARLVSEYGLKIKEVDELVNAVNAAKSDQMATVILSAERMRRERLKSAPRSSMVGRISRPPWMDFVTTAKGLISRAQTKETKILNSMVDVTERKDALGVIAALVDVLVKLSDKIKKVSEKVKSR